MTTMDCLPFDVIDYILNCDCLSYKDICRISSVSKLFNCIAKSNKLWKKKYTELWPTLVELFDVSNTDWLHEFRFRLEIKKLISVKLLELSNEYFEEENVSNEAFLYFKDISRNHSVGYEIVINELAQILYFTESHLYLTQKYYASKAMRYMRHAQLEKKWKDLLSLPPDEISFIEGACLINEWCQPNVLKCTCNVSTHLETIVKQMLEKIRQRFPNHPVLRRGISKKDRISSSLWSLYDCKHILSCINEVMFQDLAFNGIDPDNLSIEYTDNSSIEAALIDKVFEKKFGMNLALGIIYSAAAAKLGVCCEPVHIPVHFVLKLQPNPSLNETESEIYIHVMENGALKSFNSVWNSISGPMANSPSTVKCMSPVEVFIRWTWYLVEQERQRNRERGENSLGLVNALELIYILSPHDIEHKILLARLFIHLKINLNEAESLLQDIAANQNSSLVNSYTYQSTMLTLQSQRLILPRPPKIKYRTKTDGVKFAVGMIMKHKKYHYRCVIYAWDYKCSATENWIRRMGVNRLKFNVKQPFYYALIPNGSDRYAAQENLEIDHEHKPIDNDRVGKYFGSFHGTYYMPNERVLVEYPDDIVARENALTMNEEK